MEEKVRPSEVFKLTAACGLYCGECECYKAKDSTPLLNHLVSLGIKADRLPCPGCRMLEGDCPVIGEKCQTYRCATDKKVDFCFECADFPCEKLNPAADRAGGIPHNLKVYNLCYIKQRGLDKFVDEAGYIKEKYFKGKMLIGQGPQME